MGTLGMDRPIGRIALVVNINSATRASNPAVLTTGKNRLDCRIDHDRKDG